MKKNILLYLIIALISTTAECAYRNSSIPASTLYMLRKEQAKHDLRFAKEDLQILKKEQQELQQKKQTISNDPQALKKLQKITSKLATSIDAIEISISDIKTKIKNTKNGNQVIGVDIIQALMELRFIVSTSYYILPPHVSKTERMAMNISKVLKK